MEINKMGNSKLPKEDKTYNYHIQETEYEIQKLKELKKEANILKKLLYTIEIRKKESKLDGLKTK